MASITARKDKAGNIISYTIRIYRGYSADGKRIKPYTMTYKPAKNATAKQIERELKRQAVLFEQQCRSGHIANDSMKFETFCELYLDIAKQALAATTFEFYKTQINEYIIPALGHLKLKDITPSHIQQYIQQLAALPKRTGGHDLNDGTISAATVRRYLTVLQSVFKQAVKLGAIADNPAKAEKLTIPKQSKPPITVFTRQEAAKMLACLESEPLEFQTLIQLAIITGARRGELVALKFSDVDFDNYKINIQRSAVKIKGQKTTTKPPKDYESRTVTINAVCVQLLKLLREEQRQTAQRLGTQWLNKEGWVFTTWNGEIMNPQTPTKQFSKFLQRHELTHRKFHSLRHTSATLLIYGGINIKQVQTRLGHGDIETTNKYLHYIAEMDAEATKVLDNLLSVPNKG